MRVGYCIESAIEHRWEFTSQLAVIGNDKLYWLLVDALRTSLERYAPRRMLLITSGKFKHEHWQAD